LEYEVNVDIKKHIYPIVFATKAIEFGEVFYEYVIYECNAKVE